MMDFISGRIKRLKPYKVQDVAEGEIKLDAMENPYPLPETIRKKIAGIFDSARLNRYPDPGYKKLKKLIAGYCGVLPENILIGNGSDELILNILIACGGAGKLVSCPVPGFAMYEILSQLTGTGFTGVPLEEDFGLPVKRLLSINPDIIFITYPHNPTGNCFPRDRIRSVIEKSHGLVVVDEAYYEFSEKTFVKEIEKYPNLIILRTFSKAFSLAGIRAGYMVSNVKLIKQMRKVQMPYNLSIVNQKILEIIMLDKDEILASVKLLKKSREVVFRELKETKGIEAYASQANFILMKLKNIENTVKALKSNKINVKRFGPGDLKDYLRITIGTEEENQNLLDVLKSVKS